MNSVFKSFKTDTKGAAAMEFAILTPVFLMLLTGMLAYGIYFGASLSLQQLAADAVRTSISGINTTERNFLVSRYISNNAGDYILIDPASLSALPKVDPANANQYTLQLTYDATNLPIWNLYPPLPLPSKQIVHSATIRRGGI